MEILKPIKIEELDKIREEHVNFDRCLNILITRINAQLLNSAKANYITLIGSIPLYGTELHSLFGFSPDKNFIEKLKNYIIDIYKKEGYVSRIAFNTLTISIQLP